MESWISRLRGARVTYDDTPDLPSFAMTKERDVSYAFEDGSEMVEYYSLENFQLIRRIVGSVNWKKNKTLKWDYEVGKFDIPKEFSKEFDKYLSWDEPCFSRLDTKDDFQWILTGNVIKPIETYSVYVRPTDDTIILKTSSKKYYREFRIPDMDRMNLKLEQSNLTLHHDENTLTIKYKKPKEILDLEAQIIHEIRDRKDVEWIPVVGRFLLPMFLAGYDECNNTK